MRGMDDTSQPPALHPGKIRAALAGPSAPCSPAPPQNPREPR